MGPSTDSGSRLPRSGLKRLKDCLKGGSAHIIWQKRQYHNVHYPTGTDLESEQERSATTDAIHIGRHAGEVAAALDPVSPRRRLRSQDIQSEEAPEEVDLAEASAPDAMPDDVPEKAEMGPERKLFDWTISNVCLISALVLLAFVRLLVLDSSDPYKCNALLNEGRWLDDNFSNWQPKGCIMHKYKATETTRCFGNRSVVLVGDSTVRQLYYALIRTVYPGVSTLGEKHSDHSITAGDISWDFVWDPFLNGTTSQALLEGMYRGRLNQQQNPALIVFGGGLWHLRHLRAEEAMVGWSVAVDRVMAAVSRPTPIADEIVLLPVEEPIQAKLSPDRRVVLRGEDVDAMNQAMERRIAQQPQAHLETLSIPHAFNKMLIWADSQTTDGLHFSDTLTGQQANLLLNMRCNSAMPRKFPLSRTCCFQYPLPNPWQTVLLIVLACAAPVAIRLHATSPSTVQFLPSAAVLKAFSAFGLSVTLMYVADRTPLFGKVQKQYNHGHFFGLVVFALVAGLASTSKHEKDTGFLNREQTDEWKGWMQLAILIYHYFGASKIVSLPPLLLNALHIEQSPIYNPIRVLVASYIFLSGYGHFFYYYRKGDYGFARVFNVLVRLNLLPVVLAYVMDTDWLSYYFSPLITQWYLFIYGVMWLGHKHNSNLCFMLAKLGISAAGVAIFFALSWPLESFFQFTNTFLGTEWNAREWTFRVALDLYVPYVGMLAALATIKFSELRIAERTWWPRVRQMGIVTSAVAMVGWIAFETRLEKRAYNVWHPYVSMFPVISFAVLRNAHPLLRSSNSRIFAFFGRCSLETFIIQFHLWLAGDTQGLLLYLPSNGPRMRILNFVVSSAAFVFVSLQVAAATGVLTEWFCTPNKVVSPKKEGPVVMLDVNHSAYTALETSDATSLPHMTVRMGRYKKMLSLLGDLRIRFAFLLGLLWALNLAYPSEVPPSGHLLPTH